MEKDLIKIVRLRRIAREAEAGLTTCSLCLRVLQGSQWIEAERVIREIRSFEAMTAPRLRAGVCEACAESIFARRAEAERQPEAA